MLGLGNPYGRGGGVRPWKSIREGGVLGLGNPYGRGGSSGPENPGRGGGGQKSMPSDGDGITLSLFLKC